MAPHSRAVLKNEVHELILTDDQNAAPEKIVNRVSYVGFVEIKRGGVIVTGDKVFVEEKHLGELAGFDITHMPNHMNIVVKSAKRDVHGLSLSDRVVVTQTRRGFVFKKTRSNR